MTGKLAALRWFISRFTDRLKLFFVTLKGDNQAGWNEECDKALIAIKQYLAETRYIHLEQAALALDSCASRWSRINKIYNLFLLLS